MCIRTALCPGRGTAGTAQKQYSWQIVGSVPPSGSLGIYLAKVNPTSTEFTRPISAVLKRKPLAGGTESSEKDRLGVCGPLLDLTRPQTLL